VAIAFPEGLTPESVDDLTTRLNLFVKKIQRRVMKEAADRRPTFQGA
jgi:hypothetical protein